MDELLEYYQYQLRMNKTFLKNNENSVNILKEGISLFERFTNPELILLVGDSFSLEHIIKEFEKNIEENKKNIRQISLQIKIHISSQEPNLKNISKN